MPIAHPWKWAAIHGAFVVAAGIASVAAWRLNEDCRAETETAYRSARESEERFKSAFHEAPISMTLSSIGPEDGGRLVQVNRALCELLGYSEEQLLGSHFESITHPADREQNKELFAQLTAGAIPSFQLEKRYLRADGSIVWGLLNVSLVRDDQGEPRYAIAQVEDITGRKRAAQAVSQSQRQLAEAQKLARIGSWEWDIGAGMVTWSKECIASSASIRRPGSRASRHFSIASIPSPANGCSSSWRLRSRHASLSVTSTRSCGPGASCHDRSAR